MRAWILFLVCVCGNISAQAQSSKADSLERVLPMLTGTGKAIALYELTLVYSRTDFDRLAAVLREARKLENDKNSTIRSYALLSLAIGHTTTGSNDSALFRLALAKQLSLESKDAAATIRACGTLGRVLVGEGRAVEGLRNLFEALKLLETSPNAEFEAKVRVNISYAYLELKQYRNCIDFGNKSLPLMTDPGLAYIRSYIYNNAAVSYGALKMLDSAAYMAAQGLAIAKASSDNQNAANAHFILGTIYSNANEYQKAIEQYELARPYREKVGNPFFIAADLQAMSDLYYKSGKFKAGIKAGEEALAVAAKHNLLLKFENTYAGLAKNYRGLGDHQQASRYFELWAITKDSIYKHSSAAAIAEMQTRYETEKKEQQIALQTAQLSEQKLQLQKTYVIIVALVVVVAMIILVVRGRFKQKQLMAGQEKELAVREAFIDATIRSQENERKRFARDLHDGMGQLISSLRLLVNQLDKSTSLESKVTIAERSETILNEMHLEIRSIAFNLMPQTLIQHGLVPALQEMGMRLNQTGKIFVTVNGFDIPQRMNEVHEISLYRIIQEWVNNVIKYADASKIEIQLVGHEEEISITIEDNGNGFDIAVLEGGHGNGWKNIRSRTSLIKGELELDSRKGHKGTTFMLRLSSAAVALNPGVNTMQYG
jgi:signal transduction histidine kinase